MKCAEDDDLIVRLIDLIDNDVRPLDQLAGTLLPAWPADVRHAGN